MLFLLIVGIGLSFSIVWATDSLAVEEIQQGQPAPYAGGLFNDSEIEKITFDIQKLPILQDEKVNLINQVQNLKDT